MNDVQINDQSCKVGGYEPQGSIEIVAPGALQSVAAKRPRRKISSYRTSAACGGRPRCGIRWNEGQGTEREVRNCPPKRVRSTAAQVLRRRTETYKVAFPCPPTPTNAKNPHRLSPMRVRFHQIKSLAVTYFHIDKVDTSIGAERFHFRVRKGIGWFPLAMAARQTGCKGAESWLSPFTNSTICFDV
jgi:hypothetical protein